VAEAAAAGEEAQLQRGCGSGSISSSLAAAWRQQGGGSSFAAAAATAWRQRNISGSSSVAESATVVWWWRQRQHHDGLMCFYVLGIFLSVRAHTKGYLWRYWVTALILF
jgi:hypothetical protein